MRESDPAGLATSERCCALISEDHEAAHKEIRAEGPGGQRKR